MIYLGTSPVGIDLNGQNMLDRFISGAEIQSPYVTDVSVVRSDAFHSASYPTQIVLTNATEIKNNAFYGSKVTSVKMPKVENVGGYAFRDSKLVYFVAPKFKNSTLQDYIFQSTTTLLAVDYGPDTTNVGRNSVFSGCTSLSTIIFRCPSIVPVNNVSFFANTPFASGGTGGTIYIPKALYDHLGDGTSLDYKAATNWSTVEGYGTITWAQIEGSQYENYYADGTPVTA